MKSLENWIKDLENERNKEKQVEILQRIGKLLLTKYKIQIGDLTIEPLLVEAYYYHPGKFDDSNPHGFGDHKLDKECRKLQSNRFNRLFFHKERVRWCGCMSFQGRLLSFISDQGSFDQRESHNIYAKTQEECKEKLVKMITEVKAQIKEKNDRVNKKVALSKIEVQ